MFDQFDKRISVFSEAIVRKLTRRKAAGKLIKGTFAVMAAGTIGLFLHPDEAFASSCTCDDNWRNGVPCGGCPSTANCPSDCTVCTTAQSCGGWCNYPNGRWTSCTGQGTCGAGYKICTDCICPNCNSRCTCLSGCFCCSCCTKADVEAEMRRLAEMGVALSAHA